MVTGVGSPNGPSRRSGLDGWFRYPAGFSPESLAMASAVISAEADALVVDPFAGAAIGGSALIARHFRFRGLEANVLIAELAALKFSRPGPSRELATLGENVSVEITPGPIDDEAALVQGCFDGNTLGILVGLRSRIEAESGPWGPHLKWALLGTLRDVASSKVGWPYQRPDVARTAPHRDARVRFRQRVAAMARSLDDAPVQPDGVVIHGDAREDGAWNALLGGHRADACVTSPPYLNNYDYADATRLEAYFWRIAGTWSELVTVVRSPMMIATTQQTSVDGAASAKLSMAELAPSTSVAINKLVDLLREERKSRPRAKEYDSLLMSYFGDALSVLMNLRTHLRDGGRVAMVIGDSAPYGIYVDTPRIWTLLAEELGFETIADVKIRSRGLRWRTNGARHQVGLSERLVSWSRPCGR